MHALSSRYFCQCFGGYALRKLCPWLQHTDSRGVQLLGVSCGVFCGWVWVERVQQMRGWEIRCCAKCHDLCVVHSGIRGPRDWHDRVRGLRAGQLCGASQYHCMQCVRAGEICRAAKCHGMRVVHSGIRGPGDWHDRVRGLRAGQLCGASQHHCVQCVRAGEICRRTECHDLRVVRRGLCRTTDRVDKVPGLRAGHIHRFNRAGHMREL